jgi:hypothetical protein
LDLSFTYQGQPVRVTLPYDSSLRNQFASAPRSYSYSGALPRGWKKDYYEMFLTHTADREPMERLLRAFRASPLVTDDESLLVFATAFVQSAIEYDWHTAYNIGTSKIRYPSETLVEGKGVCADKTILLAALLRPLNFGLAIITFDKANHMALGLQVPAGYGSFGSSFTMIETTSPTAIGQIPEKYVGGIKLDAHPEVIAIGGTGTFRKIVDIRKEQSALAAQYGKDYLDMKPAQQDIYRQMHVLKAEIDALTQQMRGCSGTLPPAKYAECQRLQALHNPKVEAYNALVAKFNKS